MPHVYRDKKEIPIPEGAFVNNNDGRVFIFLNKGVIRSKSKRMVIGQATSNGLMFPNDNFRQNFPDQWEKHYGRGDTLPRMLDCGFYGLVLGVAHKTTLYDCLYNVFAPQFANGIMDFAMYSVRCQSNVAMNFAANMGRKALFSDKVHEDSWFSNLFCRDITEDLAYDFTDAWLRHCRELGIKDVYLAIDGSNSDCQSEGVDIAEQGHAKSHTSNDIFGYMYVVSCSDGMPVLFSVSPGGVVDSKAIHLMVLRLGEFDINVRGVIVDRAMCTAEVVDLLDEHGLPYVMMLKSSTGGHAAMVKAHGEEIRWNPDFLVNLSGLFGTTDDGEIFSSSKGHEAYLNLFYDAQNGNERRLALMGKVKREQERIERAIKVWDGSEEKRPSVLGSMSRYLTIEDLDEKKKGYKVVLNKKRLFNDLKSKGFYTIASKEDIGCEQADIWYGRRSYVEFEFSVVKTRTGNRTARAHGTEGVIGRHLVCFVASIIRWAIMDACKRKELATNTVIAEMDRIELYLNSGSDYIAVHNESVLQKNILSEFDIIPSDFDQIAIAINNRKKAVHSPYNAKPKHDPTPDRKKPGPKPGKGKKAGAAAVEAKVESSLTSDDAPGAGEECGAPEAGVESTGVTPKAESTSLNAKATGLSKGKKTKASKEEKKAQGAEAKRGRGRPKGSKNKPKEGQKVWVRPKVGRPKGSKDKQPRKRRGSSKGTGAETT